MSDIDRLIRLPEVENIVGLKRTQIYEMVKARSFPAPVKLGRASRWSLRAVSAWMDRLVAAE